jgi:hypothetical protein
MQVTANDVVQLLAAAPPRRVPVQVYRAAASGRGWGVPLFGAVFGAFGLLFTFVFFPWRFWDDWRLAADSAQTTAGVVQDVAKTNMSINKSPVIEYEFSYTPNIGGPRQGRCFSTGRTWAPRAVVVVRYLPSKPELACIEGARLSKGGWGGVFVVLFPLIGGAMVMWFVVDRRRRRWLLCQGQLAEVDVVSVDETTMKVNYQSVYRIVIQSPAFSSGQPVTIKRVNKADVSLALKRARDKQPVFVLYDPRHLKRVIFPEALIDR